MNSSESGYWWNPVTGLPPATYTWSAGKDQAVCAAHVCVSDAGFVAEGTAVPLLVCDTAWKVCLIQTNSFE